MAASTVLRCFYLRHEVSSSVHDSVRQCKFASDHHTRGHLWQYLNLSAQYASWRGGVEGAVPFHRAWLQATIAALCGSSSRSAMPQLLEAAAGADYPAAYPADWRQRAIGMCAQRCAPCRRCQSFQDMPAISSGSLAFKILLRGR